jgi:hypothetical protein
VANSIFGVRQRLPYGRLLRTRYLITRYLTQTQLLPLSLLCCGKTLESNNANKHQDVERRGFGLVGEPRRGAANRAAFRDIELPVRTDLALAANDYFGLRGDAGELIADIDARFPDESALKLIESDSDEPIFEAKIILREAQKRLRGGR